MSEKLKYEWSEDHCGFIPDCCKYIVLDKRGISNCDDEVIACSTLISEDCSYLCGTGSTADDAVRDLMQQDEFLNLIAGEGEQA